MTAALALQAPAGRTILTAVRTSTAFWILVLDIGLLLLFGLLSDGAIWTPRAVESMLLGSTQGLLLALGLAMMMGAGAFDLSLGSNLVLSSVVAALTMQTLVAAGAPVALAIGGGLLAGLVTGSLFGLVNGFLIAYLEINSLIATLATTGIGLGLALLIAGGADVRGMPVELQRDFGQASLFNLLPLPTIVAMLAAVILSLVLRYTRYGTNTLAIGSSSRAALNAGIRVKRHMVSLAILAGFFAGVAAFVDISRYSSTSLQGHNLDGLAAVTAVVIGGTLLTGGRVSILGTVAGAMLAVILRTGLIVIGVETYFQTIAIGVVLIVAMGLDRYRERRRSR